MDFFIRQLWNEFEKTGNRRLLAEALTHVDFSDPFGDNANVRKKIQDILMGVEEKTAAKKRTKKKRKTGRELTASTLFKAYTAKGMTDERAMKFVAIGLAITESEVAKILKSSKLPPKQLSRF